MQKVYIASNRNDAELEKLIHEMDAYHLRIFLYGVARGWAFDEACSIASEAAQQNAQQKKTECAECGDCLPSHFASCSKQPE
jgi:hypothetical protein